MSHAWQELHRWVKDTRSAQGLTIRQFLESYNIPALSTYVQYLSGEATDRCPSTKEGTVGKALRDALTAAMDSPPSAVSEPSPEQKLLDRFQEDGMAFLCQGITNLQIDADTAHFCVQESACWDESTLKEKFPEIQDKKVKIQTTTQLSCGLIVLNGKNMEQDSI